MNIRTFRKKPSEIVAVQFDGKVTGTESFAISYARDKKTWQVYNELHNSWINIKKGDFIRVDLEGDYYPIDAESNYMEI